jgi:hypothetical protein
MPATTELWQFFLTSLGESEDYEVVPQPDLPDDFAESLPPSLWKALHLPEPRRSDDRFAPDVDRDFLLRLVRKELSQDLDQAAFRLIHAFDSWKKAYAEILIEEFRRNRPPEADQSKPRNNGL